MKTSASAASRRVDLTALSAGVLPKGFVRIRHFGLMAGGPAAAKKFARGRALLQPPPAMESESPPPRPNWLDRLARDLAEPVQCPRCQGELHRTPWAGRPVEPSEAGSLDPDTAETRVSGTAPEPRPGCDTS